MTSKLKFSFRLVLIHLSLGLLLGIMPSDVNGNDQENVPRLEMLMFDGVMSDGMPTSTSRVSGANLAFNRDEANLKIPSFIPIPEFIRAWVGSSEIGNVSIPPAVFLLSAGLVGFICIARRSLFTK